MKRPQISRPRLDVVLAKGIAAPTPVKAKGTGKRAQGYEQICLLVPSAVRHAAKIRAMEMHRDLSDVATELLQNWLAGNPSGR